MSRERFERALQDYANAIALQTGPVAALRARVIALAQPAQGDRRRVCEVCRSSYDVAVAQPGSAPGAAEVKASVKSEVAGSNPARPSLSAAQPAPREVVICEGVYRGHASSRARGGHLALTVAYGEPSDGVWCASFDFLEEDREDALERFDGLRIQLIARVVEGGEGEHP